VLMVAASVCASTATGAQWVKHRTPDIPRADDANRICRRLPREREVRAAPARDAVMEDQTDDQPFAPGGVS
jgi:hypothetical protein